MESTSSAVDSSREIEIQTEKEKMKKKKVCCMYSFGQRRNSHTVMSQNAPVYIEIMDLSFHIMLSWRVFDHCQVINVDGES